MLNRGCVPILVFALTLSLAPGPGCDRPVPRPDPDPDPPDTRGWPGDPAEAVRRALAAINGRRAGRGAGPLVLDPGLCESARLHARGYGDGSQRPHEGFPERVRSRGWPFADCGIRNAGFGNVSEGCGPGALSPEDVLMLDDSPDPREAHRRDFEDPAFTHCGIAFAPNEGQDAWAGGRCYVVEWGARCNTSP